MAPIVQVVAVKEGSRSAVVTDKISALYFQEHEAFLVFVVTARWVDTHWGTLSYYLILERNVLEHDGKLPFAFVCDSEGIRRSLTKIGIPAFASEDLARAYFASFGRGNGVCGGND